MAPVTVQLEPMEDSNVAGEVMASHGPERVNMRVTQNGLTEGVDYEAKLKYGMCSDAQMHFDQGLTADATRTDAQTLLSGADSSATTAHDPGEEFAEIELTLTGNTGTGSAYINVDELGPNEARLRIDRDRRRPGRQGPAACLRRSERAGRYGHRHAPWRAESAPGTAAPGGDNQGY